MDKSAGQIESSYDHVIFDEKCEEDKKLNRMSSFASEFYCSHDRDYEKVISNYVIEPDALCEDPRVGRAKHRMEYLTDSQLAVLVGELGAEIGSGSGDGGGGGGGRVSMACKVDKVFAWRKKRGDFDDDEDEQEALLGEEVPQLPSDMEGVSEITLQLGFLKSDLQFECLLRNIPYQGSERKPQLISKLMHYKDTLFLNANTFQILDEQCT